jgi:hypothetical protein
MRRILLTTGVDYARTRAGEAKEKENSDRDELEPSSVFPKGRAIWGIHPDGSFLTVL